MTDWRNLAAEFWATAKLFAAAAAVYTVFTTAAFGQFYIPSESMRPNLAVGDRIAVSKYAYGWSRHSLPFNVGGLLPAGGKIMGHTPERGDVVVFRHPETGVTLIKRVIGLPGDTVAVRDGRVILNGKALPAMPAGRVRVTAEQGPERWADTQRERLPNGREYITYDLGPSALDNAGPFQVPEGQLFMMGDNRDNSIDSRVWGGAPLENVTGRAETVIYTFAPFHRSHAEPETEGRLWRRL
ncbi:signal peptidase I [Euryhalocaulis caribicus]|uniref:signal peptidase I n=1 Tax=Euryhalocaulis caribicus TaxID=1161401 RepID=UPI0003A8AE95|nr:signal peptidase I [Euryhalocaulis caribicus]